MSNQNNNDQYSGEWSLYADPELFCIRAKTAEDAGWVDVTLESEPDLATDVATTDGIRFVEADDENDEPSRLYRLSLCLKLEEIPRLVAVLNEIYLANHDRAVTTVEFDSSDDWGERRIKHGHLSYTFPLGSRFEPESKKEDWKDRIAVLQAYKIVGDRLRDDAKKLGLLQPN